MATHSSSCPENLMDRGAWPATVHGVAKSHTRLNDFTLTFHFHALEKEMATHSSVLAWRIPGMGDKFWIKPCRKKAGEHYTVFAVFFPIITELRGDYS